MKDDDSSRIKVGRIFMSRPSVSAVMVTMAVLGVLLMVAGLPPLGGVCLVIACACALTVVIQAMAGKGGE